MKKEDGLTCILQLENWDAEAYAGYLYPVTEVHDRWVAIILGLSVGLPREGWHTAAAARQLW